MTFVSDQCKASNLKPTIDNSPEIFHVPHVVISGPLGTTHLEQNFLAETCEDVRMFSKHVNSEGQRRRRLCVRAKFGEGGRES